MKTVMDAESLVLAVLDAVPANEVKGRKRLQKMTYFAVQTGTSSDAKFFLHDFGPFSTEVAAATDLLSYVGAITEEEAQFPRTKRYYKLYRLPDRSIVSEPIPESSQAALKTLNDFSTIELEIASTVHYFLSKGYSFDDAIVQTKDLKPTKSQPEILKRAAEALSRIGLYERGRTNQMSRS